MTKGFLQRRGAALRLGLILALLLLVVTLNADFQLVAAGVALFLLGMMMLEEGFKQLGGSVLERLLKGATGTLPRAMVFGVTATSVTQSSSLVSVIAISFLSAGLITLQAGIGIIFGANLGTTTGAWLIAGIGVKVDIAAYALPFLVFGVVLSFQGNPATRGSGHVLTGIGLIFLGIAFIKDGFDALSTGLDLTQLALGGVAGLLVYTLIGSVATVIMQSSHASMLLVITALAAGQISYENALAVAIGANVGTTVTAMIGAAQANYQGKRLALAHLVFNIVTALVALAMILPLRMAVDGISDALGIGATDYTLRLAVFHTLFNLLGIVLMVPLIPRLILMLERRIAAPSPSVSQPRFIRAELGDFPAPVVSALRNEVWHLYQNAAGLICEGLNMRPEDIRASRDLAVTIERSRQPIQVDYESRYRDKVKALHAEIVDFAARKAATTLPPAAQMRLQELRDGASAVVRAVKAAKHMRPNTQRFTTRDAGAITSLYDSLRTDIAEVLVEIWRIEARPPTERGALSLLEERAVVARAHDVTQDRAEKLLRSRRISPADMTSFLNDARYAHEMLLALLDAAQACLREDDAGLAQVERLLEEPEREEVAPS